ncbi:MAG: putative carbohydrate kinase [Chloroflexi bacterium]|jgi:sugar/nucleoside kinase (ribokinase family)|nr:putative carbohydrate kinase [Chloroflexota bacterium]
MQKDFDVVVVGELNADLILRGNVTPEFGQVEKLIDDATLTLGSSAAIFACGAARLGLKVAFTGKVGNDEFGNFVVKELSKRGVDTAGVVVDAAIKTGLSVILSQGDDRGILTYPGSISALRYAEIDPALLGRGRHLHLASYFLLDGLRADIPALFKAARQNGASISLDTNYDPTGVWDGGLRETLGLVDIFLPNLTELMAIAGVSDSREAGDILAKQVPILALKLGPEGALARQGNTLVRAAVPGVKVVDTTGAGDSFDAGFIYGYLNDWNLERTLKLACACGSLSTRGPGGTATQPTLSEALALV